MILFNLHHVGMLGSFLLAICALPEVLRSVKLNACYIGWGMLLSWYIGEILVLYYVLQTVENPLILAANYMFNIICISILLYYKVKGLINGTK